MLKNLKKMQSNVQGKIKKEKKSKISFKASGVREAVLDIVKAFHDYKNKRF